MSNTPVNSKPIAQADEHKTPPTESEAQTKNPDGRSKTVFWQRKAGLFGRNPVPGD
jgi:hypothetical protein